ncbi:MAG: hypothetical protein FK731_07600 [Asgard group archaeon]|nr:hypothetical protein [Asgard group archaeon]
MCVKLKEENPPYWKSNYVLIVNKNEGQSVINDLKNKELYDKSRSILEVKNKLWIPIKEKIDKAQIKRLPAKKRLTSLKEKYGLSSFDIIGKIIVIFIPDNLKSKKNEIGKYLLTLYPKIEAVYCESKNANDCFRIQEKKLIAGKGSETIHLENKLKFKLDITKVFFSPRQITEREELIKQVKKGDKVCVLFSGIGPIPIYLSKFTKASKIMGIELNTYAHKYALENLALNKVKDVELINDDVEKVLPSLLNEETFDLLVMPLPKNSGSFIELVRNSLKSHG